MIELLVIGVLVLLLASVLADRKPWTPAKGYDYLGKGSRGWLHVIGYDDRGYVVSEDSDGIRLEASKRRFARIVHQDMSRQHKIRWTVDRAADGYGKSAKTVGRWKFTLQEAVSEVEKLEKENEKLRAQLGAADEFAKHVEKKLTVDGPIDTSFCKWGKDSSFKIGHQLTPPRQEVFVFGVDRVMKEISEPCGIGPLETVIRPSSVKIEYNQNKVLIHLYE